MFDAKSRLYQFEIKSFGVNKLRLVEAFSEQLQGNLVGISPLVLADETYLLVAV